MTRAAQDDDRRQRIDDLMAFLAGQTTAVTEYSDVLTRRLVEKVTVYDDKLTVEFKSGLEIDVEG